MFYPKFRFCLTVFEWYLAPNRTLETTGEYNLRLVSQKNIIGISFIDLKMRKNTGKWD